MRWGVRKSRQRARVQEWVCLSVESGLGRLGKSKRPGVPTSAVGGSAELQNRWSLQRFAM